MKLNGQDTESFLLSQCQAAIAQHARPEDKCQPLVALVGYAGIAVVGLEALQQLRRAVDYAIDGPSSVSGE